MRLLNYPQWGALCLLALCLQVAAQEIRVPEVPPQDHWALYLKQQNQGKELPGLDYWGVAGLEWGAASNSLPARSSPARLLETDATRNLICNGPDGSLTGVRFDFTPASTNRETRLKLFQELKSRLVEAYNAPTHTLQGEQSLRGRDTYLQGLAKGYDVEWRGPETVARLRLSDVELFVEFRQGERSHSKQQQARVAAALRVQEEGRRVLESARQTAAPTPKEPPK